MVFVSVPKDLTKVKNKIIFNLTKRQLICFGIAAAVGLPFYFSYIFSIWYLRTGGRINFTVIRKKKGGTKGVKKKKR